MRCVRPRLCDFDVATVHRIHTARFVTPHRKDQPGAWCCCQQRRLPVDGRAQEEDDPVCRHSAEQARGKPVDCQSVLQSGHHNLSAKNLPHSSPQLTHFDRQGGHHRVGAVVYITGYNIRPLPILQSIVQLDATYAKDISHDYHQSCVADNHAPREQQDTAINPTCSTTRQFVSRVLLVGANSRREWETLVMSQELKAIGLGKEVFLCRDVRQRGCTVDRYLTIEEVRDYFVCSSGQVARETDNVWGSVRKS